jgi:hypothetical protein
MTTLKQAARMALEALEMLTDCYDDSAVGLEIDAIKALRAALADHNEEPLEMVEPVAWMHTKIDDVFIRHRPADLRRHPDRWMALYKDPTPCQTCEALARTVMMDQTSHDIPPAQEPYTADVVRIMREAGVTFHLGLLHKAVVEQMTRVVDLVYAEASIKAAVAFAAPQPTIPPGYKLVPQISAERSAAYDNIDRFLRNNLDDTDYATFSRDLETVLAAPQPAQPRKRLTDEEITAHFQEHVDTGSLLSFAEGARFAEAAHGITGEKE